MKRYTILLSLTLLLIPFISSAQNKDEVTGALLIKTTKTKQVQPAPTPPVTTPEDVVKSKSKLKAVEFKKGYQQEVSFAYSFLDDLYSSDVNDTYLHHINFNYVGGYRFNHHLYVGVGTGLDFAAGMNFRPMTLEGHSECCADIKYINQGDVFNYDLQYFGYLPVQKISIPLYTHLRVYFLKTKWSPFLAFSAGMRISASKKLDVYEAIEDSDSWRSRYIVGDYVRTEKYGAVTGMFEVMPGVSYQYNKNLGFNFQFGYATRSGSVWMDYSNYETLPGVINTDWYHGFTMRLGVVF